jgi:tripartite ATP-independent transporter DctM subunit
MTAHALRRGENAIATLTACALMVLPLVEIVARTVFSTGVPGAGPFTNHLTMWVSMLGAAIAARDEKLLALATGAFIPEGRWRHAAHVAAAAVGSAVAALFAMGAVQYVRVRYAAGRELAAGVPEWTTELVLPVAFTLIAVRLAWLQSKPQWGRAVACLGLGVGFGIGFRPLAVEGSAAWPWIGVIIAATVLGAPIFVMIGGTALVLFLADGIGPVNSIIDAHEQLTFSGISAIPLFTLAGFLLAEGKSSDRLLRLFRAFLGWIPGGTAVVTAVLCALFTLLTGGSGATILALGGVLLPTLLADGYRERFSLGMLTAAGSLGLLFPLSLPLLLYAVVVSPNPGAPSMEDLFLGGIVPGIVMLGLLAALGVREGIALRVPTHKFRWHEAGAAAWSAKWEILLPVFIVGSLVIGATTSESAALAALYALIVQRFIHRDLPSFTDVIRAVGNSVALSGGVLIILAVAAGFTNYLITANVPAQLSEWTQANVHSKWVFLLGLNAVLIIVGGLMDIFSATIVVVPLVVPIAAYFNVDPVHLGIIFVANAELGYLTPPVGENLFLASYRFNKPILELARAMFPMYVILLVGVLLITYVPWLTTGLPAWLRR